MARCLQLAKNGLGNTYPNPMVGSVIVYNDRIIGEGWHHQAGQPHAEVNAVNSVKDTSLLEKATIYVSLEPCSHFGKTPPCSDMIIAKGIKKVVIGTVDPFIEVAGRGIKKLMDAGCEVLVGVLEQECIDLNKRFFTFHQQKRPYIILKWAESLDGFIAPDAERRSTREPVWITNKFSKQLVHKWRAEEQSILVGRKTVEADNPSLTTRDWSGASPTRIVIDRKLKIDLESTVFDHTVPTLVFTEKEQSNSDNLKYITIDFTKNTIQQILDSVYKEGLQSVIIEGGSATLQQFIDAEAWDEARVFKGTTSFTNGIHAPKLKSAKTLKTEKLTGDLLVYYTRTHD